MESADELLGGLFLPARQKALEKTGASFPIAFNPCSQENLADLRHTATFSQSDLFQITLKV